MYSARIRPAPLTQNRLTLGDPFSVSGVSADQVVLSAALASRAENQDTIDLAVLGGLKNDQVLKGFQATHFQPFDPVHKRTEATIKGSDGKEFKVTKGAPQVILAIAANAGQIQSVVDEAIDGFARRGFRSLGVAQTDAQGQWQFLGVLPLFDPPREDSKATIATARQNGRNREDGDWRSTGHRPRNRRATGARHPHPRRRRFRRHQASRNRATGRVH